MKSLLIKARHRHPVHLDITDELPPVDIDFEALKLSMTVANSPAPSGSRKDLRVQREKLRKRFHNQPEILWVHGLAISYLRRRTPHTVKARTLFHRMWQEENRFLLKHLPLRWLISAQQTFYDHPSNPAQRTAGGMGKYTEI